MTKSSLFQKAAGALFLAFSCILTAFSQNNISDYVDKQGQLNYSSLDNWYARKVKESFLLSGKTIDLFGVGKVDAGSDFYNIRLKDPKSPWGTTNIYSKMVLDVGNNRVYPEKRGTGYCCRLETGIRKDNIAGLKVEVLIAGTLFVGDLIEPVRGFKRSAEKCKPGNSVY